MEIYAIEDKSAQLELAKKAVENAGQRWLKHNFLINEGGVAALAEKPNSRYDNYVYAVHEIRGSVRFLAERKGGILTDLFFDLGPRKSTNLPPAGLLVVIEAIRAGIPVVICTDASEVGGHHAEAMSWLHDGYLFSYKKGEAPFGWIEDKDWGKAVSLLLEMRAKRDSTI